MDIGLFCSRFERVWQTKSDFYKRLNNELNRQSVYDDQRLQDKARLAIPVDSLLSKINQTSPLSLQEDLLILLLQWFKNSYFVWVNKLNCDNCKSQNTTLQQTQPTQQEFYYGAARVEAYVCNECFTVSRFPRYNNLEKLMETRRGRCGEWANVFTLFCRAMGWDARYVLDYTDHVWTEWVHCDSCEAAFNKPLVYEQGFGSNEVVDVIDRYTRQSSIFERRNSKIPSIILGQVLTEINSIRKSKLSVGFVKEIEERQSSEKLQLEKFHNETRIECIPLPNEGRISGSVEWRSMRGEAGTGDLICGTTWGPLTKGKEFEFSKLDLNSMTLNGSSSLFKDSNKSSIPWIELTPPSPDSCGSAIFTSPLLNLTKTSISPTSSSGRKTTSFAIQFSFKITNANNQDAIGGADGFALLLNSNSSTVIGKGGSGLGYQGIPNSIAIEFDTYQSSDTCNDPNSNHISVQTRSRLPNSAHHDYSLGVVGEGLPRFNNGVVYFVRVVYGVGVGLQVLLGDKKEGEGFLVVLEAKVDLFDVLGGEDDVNVFVGFTGATGGLFQRQMVGDIGLSFF